MFGPIASRHCFAIFESMLRRFLFFVIAITLHSCNLPNEIEVPSTAKKADSVARRCIDLLAQRTPDSAARLMDAAVLTDTGILLLNSFSSEISKTQLTSIRPLEASSTTGYLSASGKFTDHRLVYECTFNDENVLFFFTLSEDPNVTLIKGLNWQPLPAPLEKLTAFSFAGKPAINYIYFFLTIAIPLFVFGSLIAMLYIPMSAKKKWKWGAIIILLSACEFTMNWNTSETAFQLLTLKFVSTGFNKPNLYSPWLLNFSIPLGALLFWINRRRLIIDATATETLSFDFENANQPGE